MLALSPQRVSFPYHSFFFFTKVYSPLLHFFDAHTASPPGNYTQELTAEDFGKEPPVLPPHLERAFLNIAPTSEDSTVLPLPHHVVINHIYSRQQDDLLILGATHRYNNRFITTVFYKPKDEAAVP